MSETQNSTSISTRLRRTAQLAKDKPQTALTNLAHHIDIEWLREACRLTRKDGATGVDGLTWSEYERHLERNLQLLLDRAKSGTYRAPPVRRAHIPKGTGNQTRPLGIPTLEDKILQRAVLMVLEAVYEQDFASCSYGFRPGRSAHAALADLRSALMSRNGGWLLEADIAKYFDTLDHAHLRRILEQRVRDGVLLRLIGKWLNAGVFEGGRVSYPDSGTPQGGVISPLALALGRTCTCTKCWTSGSTSASGRGFSAACIWCDTPTTSSCSSTVKSTRGACWPLSTSVSANMA